MCQVNGFLPLRKFNFYPHFLTDGPLKFKIMEIFSAKVNDVSSFIRANRDF